MRKTFTINGKRYDIYGKDENELFEKYYLKRRELEEKSKVKNYTVNEWAEIWLESHRINASSELSYKHNKQRLYNHILPQIGDMWLTEVTLKDCQKVMNNCVIFKDSYIGKIYFLIRMFFQAAVDEGILVSSPADKLTKPRGKKNETRRSLTPKERDCVLSAMTVNRNGLYFGLMLYCGLRPYECGYIQGKDINGNKLHVRGTKTANADRVVIIPDILVLPELEYDEYLFPHLTEQKRKRWWYSFKKDLKRFYDGELSRDLSPYCLRHTYCTDLESAGVPINIARQLMGHSCINITAKIYTHTSPEVLEMAAERINSSRMNTAVDAENQ